MEEWLARSSDSTGAPALDQTCQPDSVPFTVKRNKSLHNDPMTTRTLTRCWEVTGNTFRENTDDVVQCEHRASIATDSTNVPRTMINFPYKCFRCIYRQDTGCQESQTKSPRPDNMTSRAARHMMGLYEAKGQHGASCRVRPCYLHCNQGLWVQGLCRGGCVIGSSKMFWSLESKSFAKYTKS